MVEKVNNAINSIIKVFDKNSCFWLSTSIRNAGDLLRDELGNFEHNSNYSPIDVVNILFRKYNYAITLLNNKSIPPYSLIYTVNCDSNILACYSSLQETVADDVLTNPLTMLLPCDTFSGTVPSDVDIFSSRIKEFDALIKQFQMWRTWLENWKIDLDKNSENK